MEASSCGVPTSTCLPPYLKVSYLTSHNSHALLFHITDLVHDFSSDGFGHVSYAFSFAFPSRNIEEHHRKLPLSQKPGRALIFCGLLCDWCLSNLKTTLRISSEQSIYPRLGFSPIIARSTNCMSSCILILYSLGIQAGQCSLHA